MSRESGFQHGMSVVQAGLGWLTLAVVLAVTLADGAVQPLTYTILALCVALVFAVQVPVDALCGVPAAMHRASLVIALPYGAVMIWLWGQTMAGAPVAWVHPAWAFAPDPGARAISADPSGGRMIVMRLVCYGLIFLLFTRSARNGRHAMMFIRAFAVFSMLLALYGLQTGLAENRPVTASFVNRNSYATMAGFGTLANLAALWQALARRRGNSLRISIRNFIESVFSGGWIFALGTLVCLSALALTASRAGGLAGLAGLVVVFCALRKARSGQSRLAWVLPVLILGFVLAVMTSDVVTRMGTVAGDARFDIYPVVLQGIADRPVQGHGVGAFRDTFRSLVPPDMGFADWDLAHNSYLENAYEFGLPAAVVLYLSLAMIGVRLVLGVRRRRSFQVIPCFALGCFTVGALHAAVDFSLQIPANAAIFAAIMGIGWAQSFPREAYSPSYPRAGRAAPRPA